MRFDRQHHPSKSIALRYRIGVAALLLLIAGLAATTTARADGIVSTAPPPLTTLVKFNNQNYQIAHSPSVSLEPISATSVRKVGYGRVSEVNIATTSSGTYSSDGLVSPHVLYPGIEVSRAAPEDGPRHRSRFADGPGFSIFSLGRDPASGSTVFNSVSDHGVRSCMTRGSFVSCFRTY